MPSVVTFYYQLASYIVYFFIIISMSTIVIRMYAYVMLKSLRQHHSSNILPTYVATKPATNEILSDTYIKNNFFNGMPSFLAFYYQLRSYIHSLLFHHHFHVRSPLLSYVWICYVEKLLGNITAQTCCPLMWPQKAR